MSKKKALGRGLSALLSDSPADERLEVDSFPVSSTPAAQKSPTGGVTEIPLEEIETNPFQRLDKLLKPDNSTGPVLRQPHQAACIFTHDVGIAA